MSKEENDKKKEENLWRCDCDDKGQHANPDFHNSECTYLFWYVIYFTLATGGNNGEV